MFEDPEEILEVCNKIYSTKEDRIVIQRERNQLLTFALRNAVSLDTFDPDKPFIPHLTHQLCRAYDFRSIYRPQQSVSEEYIERELFKLWNEMKEKTMKKHSRRRRTPPEDYMEIRTRSPTFAATE